MPDVAVSMLMLGAGGCLLLAVAAYSDYVEWRKRQ